MAEELSDGDEFEAGGLAYKVTSVAAREASLIGYSVSPAKLAVPDTVSHGGVSFRVTSIGAGAFKNCDTLTSVDLGLVIEVGDQAFYGCGSLSSIDLSAVETIGFKAFPNAALVESLTIPSSVSSIGGYAFFGLQSLTSLTILTDTDSIGGGAFSGCPSLNSFKGIHPGIVDGAMLVVDGKVVSSAAGPGISGVSIPDGVSAIEGGVFSGNSYLTRVIMPDTVTALGQYAFYNCHALSDVVMSSSLESGQQERLPWNFVLRLRRGNQARRRCSLAGRRAFRPRRRKAGAHGRSRRRRRLHAVRNQVHGDVLGSVHGLHHRILRAGGVLDRAR